MNFDVIYYYSKIKQLFNNLKNFNCRTNITNEKFFRIKSIKNVTISMFNKNFILLIEI